MQSYRHCHHPITDIASVWLHVSVYMCPVKPNLACQQRWLVLFPSRWANTPLLRRFETWDATRTQSQISYGRANGKSWRDTNWTRHKLQVRKSQVVFLVPTDWFWIWIEHRVNRCSSYRFRVQTLLLRIVKCNAFHLKSSVAFFNQDLDCLNFSLITDWNVNLLVSMNIFAFCVPQMFWSSTGFSGRTNSVYIIRSSVRQ